MNPYIQSLLDANPLREPVLRSVIRSLQLPIGSYGLDVGCGIGLQTLLLTEAVGHTGQITGTDIDAELLAYSENLVKRAGLAKRITFRIGDMHCLPFENETFDWVWSADCVGYPAGDLSVLLPELRRVTRSGGSIILLAWTSQQVLPGYPLLEAQLNAACSSYQPYLAGQAPDRHFLRAARWFEAAGLQAVEAQSFSGQTLAPLSDGERVALTALFKMLWIEPERSTASDVWRECQRLCEPTSPDFILNEPGYCASFTYTMFRGRVKPLSGSATPRGS